MTRARELADLLTGGQTISTADNNPQLTLESTDADANFGPVLKMHRNSGSPADSDFLGELQLKGENDAGEEILYAQVFGRTGDVSDGTEDGRLATKIMIAGTAQNVLDIASNEIVINDDSVDLDFRVESNGNANMLFVDAGNDRVAIGETAPLGTLHVRTSDASVTSVNANADDLIVENNGNCGITIASSTSGEGNLNFIDSGDTNIGRIQYTHSDNNMIFRVNDAEKMRITSDGDLLVGKTATGLSTTGFQALATGNQSAFISDDDRALILNRKTSDGSIQEFRQDGTTVGQIGTNSGDNLFVTTASAGLKIANTEVAIIPANGDGTNSDNDTDIGLSGARFDDIFATNGTIQTSDQNEKQDIASLTTAEITAAKAISKLFKTFKWKDKVAAKGDAARTHTGIIAQEVQTAMSDAGLDASKYAFWCSDTWWENDETYTDDDGAEQTRTHTYDTADEAPEGATQRTRLGVRYPELLAFIGAATEQRLADIETRLTALEAE